MLNPSSAGERYSSLKDVTVGTAFTSPRHFTSLMTELAELTGIQVDSTPRMGATYFEGVHNDKTLLIADLFLLPTTYEQSFEVYCKLARRLILTENRILPFIYNTNARYDILSTLKSYDITEADLTARGVSFVEISGFFRRDAPIVADALIKIRQFPQDRPGFQE